MSKDYPLISVIIATFNSEKVLARCINSVLDQTYKNYELIIVDGASADNTVDIIKKFGTGISKWKSEKDNGIYEAWNKGVEMAEGDWITFIGSDDFFYPTALFDYVGFINSLNVPDLEFVSSKMHLVNQDNKLIKPLGLPWSWKKCRLQNLIAHPGSLHSKSLFENFGRFNTDFRICGDYEFLLRPGENFKTAFMDKFTVRMSQGGISANGKKLFKEQFEAVTTTGKLNIRVAKFYFLFQMSKYYVKAGIRKFGIDI
jgi:glycosyltransferase involved in cell wall biosynthesis